MLVTTPCSPSPPFGLADLVFVENQPRCAFHRDEAFVAVVGEQLFRVVAAFELLDEFGDGVLAVVRVLAGPDRTPDQATTAMLPFGGKDLAGQRLVGVLVEDLLRDPLGQPLDPGTDDVIETLSFHLLEVVVACLDRRRTRPDQVAAVAAGPQVPGQGCALRRSLPETPRSSPAGRPRSPSGQPAADQACRPC